MTDPAPRRRRPSPAVYRRRRLVLLLIVLLIAAGVTLAIWQPWRGAPATAPAPSSSSGSATPSDAADPESSADATPDADAGDDAEGDDSAGETPNPGSTASDVPPCSAQSVSVVAVTDKESYGAGELPQLSISLTNNGETACLLNVGTSTQTFTVTSGSDTWWRSTDCQSESSDLVVQVDPGQNVTSAAPLAWDRTRSSADTCGSERPTAPAGYFNLSVEIGGLAAHQSAQFVLR